MVSLVQPMMRKATGGAAGLSRRAASAVKENAMRTAGDLTELVAEAANSTLAFNPLIGLRGRDLAGSAAATIEAIARSPRMAIASLGSYAKDLRSVAIGASEVMPDTKDRRFADPAWRSNFLCKRLMQAHCLTQRDLARFIDGSSLDARG